MKVQAVRRSPAWFALRARWRSFDLASQADLALGLAVILGWALLSIFAPGLLA